MTTWTISVPSGVIYEDGVPLEQDDSTPAYQRYLAFLRAGNGPTKVPDAEPSLPRIDVSAWQIRRALNMTGLRDAVEAAVAASNDIELKDGWQHSPRFYSDNELTITMGAGLGKSVGEMYALFQLAAGL
jgi:hypothetical protein